MASRSVVILASYSPSLIRFRGALIRELLAARYHVIACGPSDEGTSAELRHIGVEFLPIGPSRTSINPWFDIVYLVRLLKLLRRVRPHAVIAYTAKPVIWGVIAAALTGVPVRAAMITGLGFAFGREAARGAWARRLARALYKVALTQASCVIFQNSDDRAEFESLGLAAPAKCHVVNGSGVELDAFRPAPLPGTGVFLLIARLLIDKGLREYVDAARLLKSAYPHARFQIVGWFDENPLCLSKHEVESWQSNGWVEYLGRLDDVRPALAGSDVYVLPSYREGTPRTVLEAMAMGRPIVTTDVPGCRNTVIDGINGFLVPARDSARLAKAMRCFLDDPELAHRMGTESRRLVEERFDARVVAKAVVNASAL
jgi:glycosyltransferase involved in cell wall biosynthesis